VHPPGPKSLMIPVDHGPNLKRASRLTPPAPFHEPPFLFY